MGHHLAEVIRSFAIIFTVDNLLNKVLVDLDVDDFAPSAEKQLHSGADCDQYSSAQLSEKR